MRGERERGWKEKMFCSGGLVSECVFYYREEAG